MDGRTARNARRDGANGPAEIRANSAVLDQARKALAASPIQPLRDLRVEQHDECLLVLGRVDSFYLKQLAQELVRTAADGVHVINEVDVDA